MSNSENISLWKKKSEIDYIPLFISLWFSLNAWIKDRFNEEGDRKLLELLKGGGNKLSDKFINLIRGEDSNSLTFKGYFAELHHALENANINFHRPPQTLRAQGREKVSFTNTVLDWRVENPELVSIVKEGKQHNKIEISSNFCITDNLDNAFQAYIENLYQVRCHLIHGDLSPTPENERLIKALYLTLSMIMKDV